MSLTMHRLSSGNPSRHDRLQGPHFISPIEPTAYMTKGKSPMNTKRVETAGKTPTDLVPSPDMGLSAATTTSAITSSGPSSYRTQTPVELPNCPRAMRGNIQHTQEKSGIPLTKLGRGVGTLWPTSQRWVRPDGPYGGRRGVGGRGKRWWPQGNRPQSSPGVGRMVVMRVGKPRPTFFGTAKSNSLGVEGRRDVTVDDLLLNFGGMTVQTSHDDKQLP
ncbi:hypothetical protein EV426DRAFT_645007 [Tirmania nivea]|nr:hypothetical protein EV426DRAFT_645007 [Tirmania nivea]